jgi:hypothetical protein
MRNRFLIQLAVILSVGGLATAAMAGAAEDYKAAYSKAEAASKKALAMKTGWMTTTKALKAAKKAGDAGKYDAAIKHAKQAEALANASIAQSEQQKKLWKDAVIR